MQITKGDSREEDEVNFTATAGIHIDNHDNAIEVHRDTLKEAMALRDTILARLNKEPVFTSSNLIVTPTQPDFLSKFLTGVREEEYANIYMAVQMTINYINSKEKL